MTFLQGARPFRLTGGAGTSFSFADDNADMRDYVTRLLSARWQVAGTQRGRVTTDLAQSKSEFELELGLFV